MLKKVSTMTEQMLSTCWNKYSDNSFEAFVYLSVGNDSDNFAILLHFLKVLFNALFSLPIRPSFVGLGESLLLALEPL